MHIYIDETGDHNLQSIQESYPIFGLGAILISENQYVELVKNVQNIKIKYFGSIDFILHASELKRPVNPGSDTRNKVMIDPEVRRSFYNEFSENIINSIDFKIIACFVLKKEMTKRYKYPIDPYYFSYENVLNRIIKYGDELNHIFSEKRGAELDIELKAEHERLSKVGIHSFPSEVVASKTKLYFLDKKDNVEGLQVTDLILSALGRYILGKKDKMIGNDLDVDILKTKLACPITTFPYA